MTLTQGRRRLLKRTILALFLLFQAWLIFIKTHDVLDVEAAPNNVPSPNICGTIRVGQTFIAPQNGLARIDVSLGTHGRTNDRNVYLTVWALEKSRRRIAGFVFNASDVANNKYRAFPFKPVRGSKGKKFMFVFHSPQSTPDNSICAWMNSGNTYSKGKAWIGGAASPGDLLFRAYSRRSVAASLPRIIKKSSGIFGSLKILVVLIVLFEAALLLALAGLLDWALRPAENNRPDQGFQ